MYRFEAHTRRRGMPELAAVFLLFGIPSPAGRSCFPLTARGYTAPPIPQKVSLGTPGICPGGTAGSWYWTAVLRRIKARSCL